MGVGRTCLGFLTPVTSSMILSDLATTHYGQQLGQGRGPEITHPLYAGVLTDLGQVTAAPQRPALSRRELSTALLTIPALTVRVTPTSVRPA